MDYTIKVALRSHHSQADVEQAMARLLATGLVAGRISAVKRGPGTTYDWVWVTFHRPLGADAEYLTARMVKSHFALSAQAAACEQLEEEIRLARPYCDLAITVMGLLACKSAQVEFPHQRPALLQPMTAQITAQVAANAAADPLVH